MERGGGEGGSVPRWSHITPLGVSLPYTTLQSWHLTTEANGEHVGFALSESIEGPFAVSGNLSWQYGNDEDPFVWQQPDG